MGEYINADQLFQCETCFHHQGGKCDAWCDHGEAYRPAMNKLKIVDAEEVKHGEWLHKNGEMVCSMCGEEALMDEVYYESPYCPDCGAKMDGKSNSEPSSNCKGCKHSYLGLPWSSAYPCNACVRAHKSDYYEQKDGRRKV